MEQFSLYRVTIASASIAILDRIHFCAHVVALWEGSKYHSVQYGTHARVLFETLAHGNSNNEIRQRNRRTYKWRCEYGKKKSPDDLNYSSGLPTSRVSYTTKQRMSYLTNLHYCRLVYPEWPHRQGGCLAC